MGNDQQADYQAIRQRIARRMRQQVFFFVHLALFVVTIIATLMEGEKVSEVILLILFWSPFLLVHAFFAFGWWGRLVDHYAQREMAKMQVAEKPKRARPVRLSDDGELVTDDELAEPVVAKHNHQRKG